ncbi:MAG: ABC transporter permease subunit/CPBP intramembrane protease [Pirellulales bacterium]
MSWRNVKLIYAREIRDQLRDRRTLFMIAVLPLLLYPLLGMSVFQLSQFLRKNEARVLLVGTEQVTADKHLPPLVEDGQFVEDLFDDPTEAQRLVLEIDKDSPVTPSDLEAARVRLKSGEVQVVVHFPADFGARLEQIRAAAEGDARPAGGKTTAAIRVPEPEILFSSAREKSRIADRAVERVLNNWKAQVVRQNLLAGRVPVNVARPFQVKPLDVAEPRQQEAVVWAKIVPFVLFIWALTGAFYPAVDLCAGEKERGTLETLLSSPALRSEIVWGKLLTVMTFSIATAFLNLTSLGVTAQYVVNQMQSLAPGESMGRLGFPPPAVIACLLIALVPMSALFSALCLALAAFARSTKEGQYYLMPLLLVTMPLMMLPMSPGSELNLGNSLIPITGVVLLLRTLVEGNYADALPYIVPVCGVTLACCLLAIRWAVYQFNQESVLFRESDRLDLRRWVVHLVRDRQETPSLAEAFFCVAVIYVIQFFTRLAISANVPQNPDFRFFTLLLFISQVVCIALPALLMTLLFTRSRAKTLLLDRPPQLAACVAAVALAVTLHPLGQQLVIAIQKLYPLQDGIQAETESMARMIASAPYVWLPFLLMAVLPAICEELAFRGFILSGLRHVGHKWWAIALSAVFFGMAHTVVQQSIAAAALGLVIGYVAVQTTSLIPAILFHASYNSIMLGLALVPQRLTQLAERWPALASLVVEPQAGGLTYRLPVVIVTGLLSVGILAWFHRLPYQATQEEKLSDARALQSQQLLGSE